MKNYKLNNTDKEELFQNIINNNFILDLDVGDLKIRNDVIQTIEKHEFEKKDKYVYDVNMGYALFIALNNNGIKQRQLFDKNFWEYLSIKILPDYVKERYQLDRYRYFVEKGLNRVWLYTIWWYFYLSFNGEAEKTRFMLLTKNFSTDTILNMVDRKGEGYNVLLYRKIIEAYSKLVIDQKVVGRNAQEVFRFIMILNTSHVGIIEPAYYKDGIDGYVKYLFDAAGVKSNG